MEDVSNLFFPKIGYGSENELNVYITLSAAIRTLCKLFFAVLCGNHPWMCHRLNSGISGTADTPDK